MHYGIGQFLQFSVLAKNSVKSKELCNVLWILTFNDVLLLASKEYTR